MRKTGFQFSLVLNRNFIFLIWTIMEIRQKNLMIMPVIWILHRRIRENIRREVCLTLSKWVSVLKVHTMKKDRAKMKLIFVIPALWSPLTML